MTRPRRWNPDWLGIVCLCGLIGCSIISPSSAPPPITTLEEAKAALLRDDEDQRLEAVRFLGDSRSPEAISSPNGSMTLPSWSGSRPSWP